MPKHILSRPDPSEYATFYEAYIELVAAGDLLEFLITQCSTFDSLRSLNESDAVTRYAPDKWSIKEVIGHVTDAERIFAYRMLRVARGDATPLAGFDQQSYVEMAHFDRVSIATLIDSFRTARAATLSLVNEIDSDGWRRTGIANGFPVTARALAYIVAGHAAHHTRILHDRYGAAV